MGTAAILGLSAASGVLGAVGAFKQAQAGEGAAEYEAKAAGQNAQLAQREAEDAAARGRDEEDRYRRRLGQLLGTQRVQAAGLGLDLAPGSSAESLLLDTAGEGARDIATIRADAAREVYGAQVQRAGALGQQGLARSTARNISPGTAAFTSALGSATQFATLAYTLGPTLGAAPAAGAATAATMRPASPWVRRPTRAPGQLYGDRA